MKIDIHTIAHAIGGFLVPIVSTFNIYLAAILVTSFFIYEIAEYMIKHDRFVFDTRVFVTSLFSSSLLLAVLEVLKWVKIIH